MKKLYDKKYCQGFTFIELIVTAVIIGIMAAIGLSMFGPSYMQRARDAKRKANLQQIKSALEIYRADEPTGRYPNGEAANGYRIKGISATCGTEPIDYWDWFVEDWVCSGAVYMKKLPTDTIANYRYYSPGAGGSSYTLEVCLEYEKDTGPDTAPKSLGQSCTRVFQLTNP